MTRCHHGHAVLFVVGRAEYSRHVVERVAEIVTLGVAFMMHASG